MAKTARKAEEIVEIRKKILSNALDIIVSEGFVNFSMRKLASRLGMTAANIYNYFNNKDEIYILIRAKGFEMLSQAMNAVDSKKDDPISGMEKLIRSYIDFGVKNPDYYEIMFNNGSPKYLDYIGTAMEDVASEEMKVSSKMLQTALDTIKRAVPCCCDSDLIHHLLKIWIMLNGIVNLHNNSGEGQINHQIDNVIQSIIEDTINAYR